MMIWSHIAVCSAGLILQCLLLLKHIDVLVITEAKLDDSFPTSQFLMTGFAEPFRLDQDRNGGGVMIYI